MIIIKDPSFEPYFIIKDEYCCTIAQILTPTEKYTENGGVPYTKYIFYYPSLVGCIENLFKKLKNQPIPDNIQKLINDLQDIRSAH